MQPPRRHPALNLVFRHCRETVQGQQRSRPSRPVPDGVLVLQDYDRRRPLLHEFDDRRVEALLVQSGLPLDLTAADRLIVSAESFQRRQDRFAVVGEDPGVLPLGGASSRWR